ncbi:MAG: TetR/AcrR family transcriptional regulator [Prevotella sp.]|jgi:AcrR family transcriptional regulator|nr:TetR/AcrR family transcriptional regulator [Prevotella sp.]
MVSEDLILKKTFKLLLLKGFDRVSITDIQNATGLSRGLLYHYYKNKEDLFIQVTEKYFIEIFDFDIRKVTDLTIFEFIDFMFKRFDRIEHAILDIVKNTNDIQGVSMLNYHFLFYQVMQRDAIFRNRYQATIEKEKIGWENALKNSITKKEIKSDTNIVISAKELVTLTDGVWFQSIYSVDGKFMIQKLETTLFHYIDLLK